MADKMGRGNTRTTDADALDQHIAGEQDRLAHMDDAEEAKRVVPNQGTRTQSVTTADDARRNDQRSDGGSPEMNGGQTNRRDDLGTPVNPPTGTGEAP